MIAIAEAFQMEGSMVNVNAMEFIHLKSLFTTCNEFVFIFKLNLYLI
jgi:hypothetical protein